MVTRSWGAETLVNTSTAGDQDHPAITNLSGGRYVVAWIDKGTSPASVKMQIYNGDGTKSGPELNGPPPSSLGLANVDLATLSNGNFVLTVDRRLSGTDTDVTAYIYNSAGVQQASASVDRGLGVENESAVAATDSGYVVAWVDDVSTFGKNIELRSFPSSGSGGSTVVATPNILDDQARPDITVLRNGNIVVVWDDGTTNVQFQRYDSSLSPLGGIATIVFTSIFSPDPKITALANGGFVVVYTDTSTSFPQDGVGVYVDVFEPDGSFFSTANILGTTVEGSQFAPQVTALADGGFYTAWYDINTKLVMGQQFDYYGNRIGPETVINSEPMGTAGDDFIRLTTLDDGRVVVIYENHNGLDGDQSGSAIVQQIIDPRGGVVRGTNENNVLYGNYTDDELKGLDGVDVLYGLLGNDFLRGGEGDDLLEGGAGTDALFGGSGTDTASYANAEAGVAARLDNAANFGEAAGDFYDSIENLLGSQFQDFLVGDENNNVINGGGGGDTMFGQGGDDVIIAGAGAEIINGGQGNDTVSYGLSSGGVTARLDGLSNLNTGDATGDTYADIENIIGTSSNDLLVGNAQNNTLNGGLEGDFLFGFDGDDTMIGGFGADALDGGAGRDTASYQFAISGVQARLDGAPGSGEAAGDSFTGIEDLTGSNFVDFLVGDGLGNILRGGDGGDTIFGQGGNDVIFGGFGTDTLNGGFGSDTFYYDATSGAVTDIIQDFDANDVNEKLFFAGLLNGTFTFLGSNTNAFTGTSNTEARFNDSTDLLELDTDGDGSADLRITLQGVSLANLDATDFAFG